MKILIPKVPPSPNELRRKYRNPHVYKQLRDDWQLLIAAYTPPATRTLLKREALTHRMIVQMVFYNSREYDPDNLPAAQKPVLDALKNIGYIRDDSTKWLMLLSPRWSPAMRKESKTEIEIQVGRPMIDDPASKM